MKKISTALFCLTIIATLIIPFSAFAKSNVADSDFISNNSSYDYSITAYDVKIDVGENNVYNITETIWANFNEPRHGIYRKIPTVNNVKRADGTSATVKAKISSIRVNENYSSDIENGYFVLKIGDENKTFVDDKKYVINYKYDVGKDTLKDADEFYFNLIGSEWTSPINNVTFTVTMPKEFDKSKLGFSSGKYGTETTNNIYYNVDGNKISGYFGTVLNPGDALTMRLTLPDGYFTFDYALFFAKNVAIALFPLIALIIVVLLFFKYGKDKHIVPTVEFYPPDGMNSAEAGLWLNGLATNEGIISLLVYLADKGYIAIEQDGKKDFYITRKKEYDGTNIDERTFLGGLFKGGIEKVHSSELKDKFYVYIEEIRANLNSPKSRNRIFSRKSFIAKWLCFLMIAVCTVISGFFLYNVVGSSFGFDSLTLIFILISAIFIIAAVIVNCFMLQRTEEGYKNLGKLTGFKNFLDKAEKDKLEALVEENPQYFYNILPYTYALGVSDKWMSKFKSIALEPPTWYYSRNTMFDYIVFSSFMRSAMNSATTNMVSQPSSSGSGGFSGGGGGFAGGGIGGGGGGSW